MGGYSSGRKSEVNCTDDQLAIDARQWQREGRLVVGASFNSSWSRAGKEVGNMGVTVESGLVILFYSWQKNEGEAGRLNYPVSLHTTSCHYYSKMILLLNSCSNRIAWVAAGRAACRPSG